MWWGWGAWLGGGWGAGIQAQMRGEECGPSQPALGMPGHRADVGWAPRAPRLGRQAGGAGPTDALASHMRSPLEVSELDPLRCRAPASPGPTWLRP